MANEVIWYDSAEVGAPTLNNAAGSLIALLDACLLNGFNLKTVTINVTGGVATATSNGHGFKSDTGKLLLVAGATPAALNGLKQPTVIDANTFTFPAPGVPDGAATGTITAKRAPLGWTKAFAGTNKAAYKSSDVTSSGRYLRVDDTNSAPASGYDARVVMYESMSDVDTGTGPAPTAAQLANGGYWPKSDNTATARQWALCGDGKFFYFFPQASTVPTLYCLGFGDINSYRAADAYHCTLWAFQGAQQGVSVGGTSSLGGLSQMGSSPSDYGSVLSRISAQTGSAVRVSVGGLYVTGNASVWASASAMAWPSPVDNGLLIHRPIYVTEENVAFTHPVRGEMPGMLQLVGRTPYNHKDILTGIDGYGNSVLVLAIHNGSAQGRFALDVSGPWR